MITGWRSKETEAALQISKIHRVPLVAAVFNLISQPNRAHVKLTALAEAKHTQNKVLAMQQPIAKQKV